MARSVGGREEWERAKAQGLQRFLVTSALRRGIPMAIAVLLLLEVLEGADFSRARFLSADFAERVLFVLAVFLAGGAISAFARWKSFESLYEDDDST
jgi:hypothetical protein